MRLGINLADRVHLVSPGYAREVLLPNGEFHHGGEGLEADLRSAEEAGRLHGILNGCEYPDTLQELAHASPEAVYEAVKALVPRRVVR